MRTFKLYFYGFLILLFVIFVLQNYYTLTYSVSLRFNLGFISLVSIPLPLFLVAPLFFFTGLFLATIVGSGERRRLSKEIKKLKSYPSEPKPVPKQESKLEVNQPFRPEPRPEPKPEPQPDPRPENKPMPESKKKPDEGTIVSAVPLIKKPDSSEENKPPFPF